MEKQHYKEDICGKTIWSLEGDFHHLMSLNGEFIWALKKKDLVITILRRIR